MLLEKTKDRGHFPVVAKNYGLAGARQNPRYVVISRRAGLRTPTRSGSSSRRPWGRPSARSPTSRRSGSSGFSRSSSRPRPRSTPTCRSCRAPARRLSAGSSATCVRDNYTMYPLQVRFFQLALRDEDQLRQRVALALHEILVVSGVERTAAERDGPVPEHAPPERVRELPDASRRLTLSPAMGDYLDMVNNPAAVPPENVAPNENYAREVLQLFSVGVDMLNEDGSPQRTPRAGRSRPTSRRPSRSSRASSPAGRTPRSRAATPEEQPAELQGPDVALPGRRRAATRPRQGAEDAPRVSRAAAPRPPRRTRTGPSTWTRRSTTSSCTRASVPSSRGSSSSTSSPPTRARPTSSASPALRRRRPGRPRRPRGRRPGDPPRPGGPRRREERPRLRAPSRARPLRHEPLPGPRRDERRRPRRAGDHDGADPLQPGRRSSATSRPTTRSRRAVLGPEFGIQSSTTTIGRVNFVTSLVFNGIGRGTPSGGRLSTSRSGPRSRRTPRPSSPPSTGSSSTGR